MTSEMPEPLNSRFLAWERRARCFSDGTAPNPPADVQAWIQHHRCDDRQLLINLYTGQYTARRRSQLALTPGDPR